MEKKMSIKEAVRSRYERFNRLWMQAEGHTFEEDEKWCRNKQKEEMKEWNKKLKPVLKKHGFKSLEDYQNSLEWIEDDMGGGYYKNLIEEISQLLKEKPNNTSLFGYEKFCISEAEKCAKFVMKKGGEDWWVEKLKENNQIYSLVEMLKGEGFSFSDGHSGNTMGMSIMFANCLIRTPELFQYMHGALTPLVGDEGYHDDRSDIPNFDDEEETKEEEK